MKKELILKMFVRTVCIILIFILSFSLVLGSSLAIYIEKKVEKSIDEMTCFTDNHGEVVAIYYPDNEIMRALKVFPRNTL